MKRKLTAIFHADVVGYSRLMGAAEDATFHTLLTYREEMLAIIGQHHGRLVNTAGDSLLVEFASVVEAVQCAVVIQATLKAENASLPLDRRMQFRIGVNLGDVMVEGDDLYGDGVNIAARVEALAEPGGICISGTVYDHIKNKLALHYEDLGEQQVKNIAEPVRVYGVVLDGTAVSAVGARPAVPKRRGGTTPRTWALGAMAGLVLIAGTILTVRSLSRPTSSPQPLTPSTQAEPALPLPDKPSIAVLPFANMSNDPEQEYFSDGITEDLITALSKLSGLFVISRNSAFTYKGKAVKVADVKKELGVRYVLEGSVRKANKQIRVTAQLVDASADYHIWAERYDRPLQDIFAVQDEIVRKIVTTLKLQLTLQEQGILVRKTTDNLEAYDYVLRGTESYWQSTKEANIQARRMYEKAAALDPQYAVAYVGLGWTYLTEWTAQWNRDPQVFERANELAQKAIALDNSLPGPHALLGLIYLLQKRQHDQAIAEGERAIALDPNWADGYVYLAIILRWSGRAEEAIELVKKAMRLNPRYPAFYQFALGFAYCPVGRYEEAIAAHKEALSRNPNLLAHACLAGCYSMAGRDEEARAQVQEILRISPNYSLEAISAAPYKDPADWKPMLDALRKAGLK